AAERARAGGPRRGRARLVRGPDGACGRGVRGRGGGATADGRARRAGGRAGGPADGPVAGAGRGGGAGRRHPAGRPGPRPPVPSPLWTPSSRRSREGPLLIARERVPLAPPPALQL